MARRRFSRLISGAAVGGLTAALLVVGAPPTSATPGSTTVVSLDAAGVPIATGAFNPAISGDGNVVVFQAGGALLARNRSAGTTERVDVLPPIGTGEFNGNFDINGDGRYVVFDAVWYDGDHCTAPSPERVGGEDAAARFSDSFTCTAVFRRDLQTDTTILVSTSDDESTRGDGASQLPTVSADGNRIAFDSTATDLTAQAANALGSVYLRDVSAGTTELVSVNINEEPANDYSQASRISANGQAVLFGSAGTNFFPPGEIDEQVKMWVRRLDAGDTWPLHYRLVGWVPAALNADGTRAVVSTTQPLVLDPSGEPWEDTDHDIFVFDVEGGDIEVAGGDVGQTNSASALQLSDDGRYAAALVSLGPADREVRVFDTVEDTWSRESVRSDDSIVFAELAFPRKLMSSDGRFITFASNTEDVTPDDVDGVHDVFVHDRATPTQDASGTGSASTDSGAGPTLGDPLVVSVSGSPGEVAINEMSPQQFTGPVSIGYSLLGQPVEITADPPTPPAFLTFTFDIDVTAVPSGGDPSDADVLRNGVALTDCSSASDPGPCVASRSVLPSGDWRLVAHSPQASTWAVATPIGDGPAPPDTTDPTVDLRTPADGATYAQGESVIVDYDCADTGGAGLLSCVGDQADGAALDTSTPGPHTFSVTATDNAGNDTTATVTYTVQGAPTDTTDPTITITNPVDGASYPLGSTVLASYSCADSGGSGLVSCVGSSADGAPLPTGSLGSRTFTVTATDGAGNSATTTVAYRIVWPLTAFIGPVDNPPVVNTVKAGKIVPVRFSLGGNRGSSVFATGYPQVTTMTCPGSAPTDEIESTLSGKPPTLSYSRGTYTYAFRTSKSWVSRTTCRVLTVRWADGQERTAIFKLR